MPDLQEFSITPAASATVVVPRYTIAGRITDSQTGATLADFTGATALQFPGVLATLSASQRQAILDLIATMIVMQKGGFA